MKRHAITALLLLTAAARAATITAGDPVPNTFGPEPDFATLDGGVGYAWQATLGQTDSGSIQGHVGAWSWEDNALFGPGDPAVGWTHTSTWVALTLLQPSWITIRLERQAGVPWPSPANPDRLAGTDSMFPSFTLYGGWDGDGTDHHTYNNTGNVAWAEDIAYLTHIGNSTLTTVEGTWLVPAGQYSLVLGSNAPATNPTRQGFRVTLTTTIPEPAAFSMAGLSLASLLLRRRRR